MMADVPEVEDSAASLVTHDMMVNASQTSVIDDIEPQSLVTKNDSGVIHSKSVVREEFEGGFNAENVPFYPTAVTAQEPNVARRGKLLLRDCKICDKSFATKNELDVHNRTHTGEQPYQCEKCGRCFGHHSNLLMHLRHHSGEKPFRCEVCQKSFIQRCDLQKHSLRHTKLKQYKCRFCPKAFKHRVTLHKHFNRLHGAENFDIIAELNAIDGLLHNKKPRGNVYKCTFCPKSFAASKVLEIHIAAHTGRSPYNCTTCNKSFFSRSCLRNHLKLHTGEKLIRCEYCEKVFYHRGSYTIHIRTHTKEKPFKCESCDKAYAQRDQLKIHMRSHTGERPFSCQLCNQSFTLQTTLRTHMRTHSGEKPFSCPSCDQSFSVRSTLTRHLRVHTGEKPYTCKYCEKSFSDAGHLRRHEKRMHERAHVRPEQKCFECDVCKNSFNSEGALILHSYIHNGEKLFAYQLPCKLAASELDEEDSFDEEIVEDALLLRDSEIRTTLESDVDKPAKHTRSDLNKPENEKQLNSDQPMESLQLDSDNKISLCSYELLNRNQLDEQVNEKSFDSDKLLNNYLLNSENFKVLMDNSRKTFIQTLKRLERERENEHDGHFENPRRAGFRCRIKCRKSKDLRFRTRTKVSAAVDFDRKVSCFEDSKYTKYSYNERPFGCGLCLETFETKSETLRHFCISH